MKELQFFEKDNARIWEVESVKDLDRVYADNNDTYYYNEYQFKIKRVNNDINGNPLYKIQLSKNFEDITSSLKGLVYRCYPSKKYALIQSYNLSNSLENIFSKIK